MIKNVFLDFNGTIIDDLDLCLKLLNKLLLSQNKKEISLERYREIFTFPIIKYYEAAGIDFSIEPFDSLAIKFIKEYQPASLKCSLFPCVIDTVKCLKEKGVRVFILSASEKNNLLEQCKHFKIDSYFDDILGIDNIHAGGKIDIAKRFIEQNSLNLSETVFIGDTLHDYEVALAMGVSCRLVSCGHQSIERLKKANVPIYSDISGILKEFDKYDIN